jgi:hypothetical protein
VASPDLRKEVARTLREVDKTYRSSETDGFIPELASAICTRQQELDAYIAERGGVAQFPALFDLDGNLVAAKQVESPFGFVWGILSTDDPDSEIINWFNPSRALNPALERKKNARHGFYVGTVEAPATAKVIGFTAVAIVRADGGFNRNVTIVDNGCNSQ